MTGSPATTQPQIPAIHSLAAEKVTALPPGSPGSRPASDQDLWAQVIRQARCVDSSLDADEWFPVSAETERARQEAAAAIAVCQACPVRGQCLALSLRHWDIGRHGVWGGMVEAERAGLRHRMLARRADALRFFTDAVDTNPHR